MKKIIDFLNRDLIKFDVNSNSKIIKGREKYSGFFRRFGATMVDLVLFSVLIITMVKFRFATFSNSFFPSLLLIYPLYGAIFLKIYGMTLGKYVFGIKLRGENNIKINFFTLIIREYILKPISIIPLGFGIVRMFFDPHKQTYYDKKIKTEVVIWRNDWINSLFIFAAIFGLVFEIMGYF